MHEDGQQSSALNTHCIRYARVSTKKQREAGNLARQLGRLTAFAAEQRWTVVAALTDGASGVHEKRRGVHHLLDLVRQRQAGMVVAEDRDRLARFGFGYLEPYLPAFGARVVVVDQTTKDDQQELVDLIAITTSFSARIDGKRGGQKIGTTVRQAMATLDEFRHENDDFRRVARRHARTQHDPPAPDARIWLYVALCVSTMGRRSAERRGLRTPLGVALLEEHKTEQ
ncbi:MAG: IS607 family transposase [Thermaerobacter sp.]|nr:IS607 family transposase [Thermaerobacter sp.]